jgi:hypothetical protein
VHTAPSVAARLVRDVATMNRLRTKYTCILSISLGPHRVRDLPGWTEIFQLRGPLLTDSFPPLVTLDTGLPPLAEIVMIDAIDTLNATDALNDSDSDTLLGSFSQIFASSLHEGSRTGFARARSITGATATKVFSPGAKAQTRSARSRDRDLKEPETPRSARFRQRNAQ